MLPAVALIGRPNVGKSTLFNRLTASRDALVADEPGVTRDRRYGIARFGDRDYVVIDTGGVGGDGVEVIESQVARQVDFAVAEADAIVFVVDHRQGLLSADHSLAEHLRRTGKPVTVAVNKSEGVSPDVAVADFHSLGVGEPYGISALRGTGVRALTERFLAPLEIGQREPETKDGLAKIAVVGRPNVGKSTLINRLIGDERLVTSPLPGTTRDSLEVDCERDGQAFVLVDTAGIRRRARVDEGVEKFSVVQSLRALENSGAAIVLLDAREGITDQDLHLVGLAADRGSALVIGINKWDEMSNHARQQIRAAVDRELRFVPFAKILYLSALHGSGISEVVRAALKAHRAAGKQHATARLNDVLKRATDAHSPPTVRGRSIRLRYAHQGGRFPPLIIVHGSQAERIPAQYRRYLENAFREILRLEGTPLKVEFRSAENPFAGRRNVLSPRQAKRRKRVIRHSRR
jgi:GTP-binding protein